MDPEAVFQVAKPRERPVPVYVCTHGEPSSSRYPMRVPAPKLTTIAAVAPTL
jgi:hypothetical protein